MSPWTVTATVDETVNTSTQMVATPVALNLPVVTSLLVPESSSTRITSSAVTSSYQLSPQWSMSGRFAFQMVDYSGNTRVDRSWIADAILSYSMWQNMTLTWNYQFSAIDSTQPGVSANRNFVSMGALYKF
jgi:uncharacterized protein (PEP-CTERM system associated)